MRAYFFANMYLSGLQKGLQAAHCLAEISLSAQKVPKLNSIFKRWAVYHKTIIILNGGSSTELNKLASVAKNTHTALNLPMGCFSEDGSLNYAMTCVGIIVPKRIYLANTLPGKALTKEETWLYNEIWSRVLA